MKIKFLILALLLGLTICAQNISTSRFEKSGSFLNSVDLVVPVLFSTSHEEIGETYYSINGERLNFYEVNFFSKPSAPFLTTSAMDLEICTGNRTRLTATSPHLIFGYTTPPPMGSPVGSGTCYITPELTSGYYTYYAIAENAGIKSDISAMEVVMVYPTPTLTILSSTATLCSKETATLTVSGTTYYEWDNGANAAQITIRPLESYTYKVTGINTAGCVSTAAYTQSVEMCSTSASFETVDKRLTETNTARTDDRLFSVYPNPNTGVFNIHVNSISENTRIELYTCMGQIAFSTRVTNDTTLVTLNDYPTGMYIVRILENDKILKQQKVLKE